jgi:hypothetical protein
VYFNAENVISSAIKYVTNENIPMVYFTQGHGEKNYEEYYSKLIDNLIKNNYNSKPLDLTTATEIPADAGLVVVVGPTEDFSTENKTHFSEYFDRGGRVVFMLEPSDSKNELTNIEDILEEYSFTMNYDRVVETDGDRIVAVNESEAQDDVTSGNTVSTDNVAAYVVNLSSPAVDQKTGELSGTVDFTSAIIASSESDADAGQKIETLMPPSRSFGTAITDKYYQLELGTLISTNETTVSEPFGGNKIDVSANNGAALLAAYSIDANRKNSAVIVFGADVVNNERTESPYFMNPMYVFLTILSWACESESNAGVPEKMVTYDLMSFDGQEDADKVIAIMWVYPIVIAALGVIVVWLRRAK